MSSTTILMRLRQFQRDELHNLASDFDQNHPVEYARSVWWAFQDEFGNAPHKPGVKSIVEKPNARVVADAWTRADTKFPICRGHFLPTCRRNYRGRDRKEYKLYGSFVPEGNRRELGSNDPIWAYARFPIVFRGVKDRYDERDDTPRYDGNAAAQARTAIDDVVTSADHLFTYQHRTAAFFLLVNFDEFRVMRWDRSGVALSESVNYLRTIKGTRALLEVTYAFSRMSRVRQGIDTSAVRLLENSCGWQRMSILAQPSPHDLAHAEALFDTAIHDVFVDEDIAATYGALSPTGDDLHHDPTHLCSTHAAPPPVIPVFSYIRQMFRDSLASDYPRYRLTVDGHDYLVCKPCFFPSDMICRGTRGYIALEWETQRLVFLKDTWRIPHLSDEHEGAVLAKLNAQRVANVPTIIRYGDVHHAEGDCGVQTSANSDYHPTTGSKRVDHSLPPFAHGGAEKASMRQGEVEEWFNNGTERRSIHPALKGLRHTIQLPVFYECVPMSQVFRPVPASMPIVPAFPEKSSSHPSNASSSASTAGPRGVKRSHDATLAQDQGSGLFHLVHSRTVVKEICLDMLEFTSSRQLVRLIFDCVVAHGQAYKRCGYIHGDVSSGNVLILPQVRRTDKGKYGVSWRGFLADWEFARHTAALTEPRGWGTWDFMSAYRLLNHREAATIPDELESFVHVLIFYAIVYMQSNIHPRVIQRFLEEYFSGHPKDPWTHEVTCPRAKRDSVASHTRYAYSRLQMNGTSIKFATPGRQLEEHHPLNYLVTDLLRTFHSRYVVHQWETRPPKPREVTPPSPVQPKQEPKKQRPFMLPEWPPELGKRPSLNEKPAKRPPRPETPPPSPSTYATRASLDHHHTLAHTLYTFAIMTDHLSAWPEGDVIPDRRNEERKMNKPSPAYEEQFVGQKVTTFELELEREAQDILAELKPDPLPMAAANSAGDSEQEPEAVSDPPAELSGRPAKRRRRDPVVDEAALLLAESSTQRVTRSRSAAHAAAESTRLTRSMTGKLPGGKPAVGTPAGPAAGRGRHTRTPASQRRGAARSRDTTGAKARGRQSRR